MPSKKKKYNARFPAGRIKKIMQTDEEIGKVAQAVPVIISRTLELFVESLLTKAVQITSARNAKTLTPSHMKQCILSENRFDFLKDLVKGIPDVSSLEEEPGTPIGNLSPGLNLPRTHSNLGGFQFNERKLSDSSSSKSFSVTSQNSTDDDPVFLPGQPSATSLYPKFYNEIPIECEDSPNDSKETVKLSVTPQRTPVIQHTSGKQSNIRANNPPRSSTNSKKSTLVLKVNPSTKKGFVNSDSKTTNSSSDEDEENEEQETSGENGFYQQVKSGNSLSAQLSKMDEDYDT